MGGGGTHRSVPIVSGDTIIEEKPKENFTWVQAD